MIEFSLSLFIKREESGVRSQESERNKEEERSNKQEEEKEKVFFAGAKLSLRNEERKR